MKKNFKRLFGLLLVIAMVIGSAGPIKVDAAATNTLTITFQNGYDASQGKVQYSLDYGATWIDVTSNVNAQAINVTGERLKVRIVPENGYVVDPTATSYSEDTTTYNLSEASSGSVYGGLTGSNGYESDSNAVHVKLENVEFRVNDFPGGGGGQQPQFDGNAIVLWSCNGKLCKKAINVNAIDNEIDGVKYISANDITDEIGGSEKFDVHAQLKGWTLPDRLDAWSAAYRTYKGLAADAEIDWTTVDPEDIIGNPIDMREWEDKAVLYGGCNRDDEEDVFHGCVDNYVAQSNTFTARVQLQPVGEPDQQNAYVSYGDRNFKVTIYGTDYRSLAIGNLDDLTYYPALWTDSMFRQDAWDISETTADNPAEITTLLLESTVNLKSTGINGLNLASIKALDVPDGAVNASIVDGNIKIVFSSNFYDNVVFEIKDAGGNTYYVRIVRQTLDVSLGHDNHTAYLSAMFYFDRNRSYTDYVLTAKMVYLDGTTKTVELQNYGKLDMGGDNWVVANEVDEQNPPAEDQYGNHTDWPLGKGLKKAYYRYEVSDNEARNISKIYVNVEKVGSTTTNYAGALAGSGEGIEIDVNGEGRA